MNAVAMCLVALAFASVPGSGAGANSAIVLTSLMTMTSTSPFVGGGVEVIVDVTNTDWRQGRQVSASLNMAGDINMLSLDYGPVPAEALTLAPGLTTSFTWNFSIVGTGTVFFTSIPFARGCDNPVTGQCGCATTCGDGACPIPLGPWTCGSYTPGQCAVGTDSGTFTVGTTTPLGLLDAAMAFATTTPFRGSQLEVTSTVTNTGAGDVINVVPTLLIGQGSELVEYLSGPLPSSTALLTPGSDATFTWMFNVLGSGTVFFSGETLGVDRTTGTYLAATVSNGIAFPGVPASATLYADLALLGSTTLGDSQLLVTFTVTNTGAGTANEINPELILAGDQGVLQYVYGPLPTGPTTLAPGASATYAWLFSMVSSGTVFFTGRAAGRDIATNDVLIVTDSSSLGFPAGIPTTATLFGEVAAISSAPYPGGQVMVTFTLTNSALGTVTDINPSLIMSGSSPPVSYVYGPQPTGPVNLGPGLSQTFTWMFNVVSTGTMYFTTQAVGQDKDSGEPLSVTISRTLVLPGVPPSVTLMAAGAVSGTVVFVGDTFIVSMTVTVTGSGGVTNLTPNMIVNSPTSAVMLTSGPIPVNVPLVGTGMSQSFYWQFQVVNTGPIWFTMTANGRDQITLAPVSIGATTMTTAYPAPAGPAGPIVPAAIDGALSFSTTAPVVGDVIRVTYTVTNTGPGNVGEVIGSLVIPWFQYTLMSQVDGPEPASVALMTVGTSAEFTWTFVANTAGTVDYLAEAEGGDIATGGKIRTSPDIFTMTIYQPAALVGSGGVGGTTPGAHMTATLSTLLQILAVQNSMTASDNLSLEPDESGVKVILTVSSDSPAVVGASASVRAESGAVDVALARGPLPHGPVTLGEGVSQNFTWLYTARGKGRVTFEAIVSGVDAETGDEIESTATGSIVVEPPPGVGDGKVKIVGGPGGTINPGAGHRAKILIRPTAPGEIRIRIFTMRGRLVAELVRSASGGSTEVLFWDGRDMTGAPVPPGTYPVLIEAPGIKERLRIGVMR